MAQKLTLEDRNRLTMNAVTEVVSFEESTVVLQTELGTLVVQGRELKLKTLSLEGGQVTITTINPGVSPFCRAIVDTFYL